MATPRGGLPFVYTTWITGLLAGEQECVYASWFKANYRYSKREDTSFDLAAWSADHTKLLRERVAELTADGWRVRVENENAFRLKGATALLAGKPDLVALKNGTVRVVDVKTGQPRNRDWHQVLVYLFAVPKCWPELAGYQFEGEVRYRNHGIPIAGRELTAERVQAIVDTIKAVAATTQPAPRPSAGECRWCDVGDCQARIEGGVPETAVAEW